ncbi:DUF2254 domain-containing protein [Pseudoxanthomonas sp. GM95]|uniref:DUF2254 domain-containing protein n=1 Tax=Pseudoxanthomonas sp. GM95 TaxID=1881043 RepID=UPI0020C85A59|nr:DUF2254 domain-containing protein [Pseudoxanthomonas sp. GM95]
MSKWKLSWGRVTRRMWFRSTLYGALGVATALAGAFAKFLLPTGLATRIGADSVGNILGILAASMLTVTIFSLSTMVSAYGSASSGATPRAARLLIEDTRAQGALATFIGAFLFSIVGLIALSTGIYGDSGRLVLFGATIAVIVVITVTLLRSIEQLSRFGRMGETIDLVERATLQAMRLRADDPLLGASPAPDQIPEDASPLCAGKVGYVEHIDTAGLSALAEQHDLTIQVTCQPGTFATPDRPLLSVQGRLDGDLITQLQATFSLGDTRIIENDPRYGLVVLTEIAQRAMSPAVNDPGTCIDVIGTCVRLLNGWAEKRARGEPAEVRFPRVHMAPLAEADMFDDIFPPISRDAAASLEVNIRLQKAYAAIAASGYAPMQQAASAHAALSLARALQHLDFAPDRARLSSIALRENGLSAPPQGTSP